METKFSVGDRVYSKTLGFEETGAGTITETSGGLYLVDFPDADPHYHFWEWEEDDLEALT